MTIEDVIRFIRACASSYEASAYAYLPRKNDETAPEWKWAVRGNKLGKASVLRLIADDIEIAQQQCVERESI